MLDVRIVIAKGPLPDWRTMIDKALAKGLKFA
jgi:hypothetical protein